MSPCGVWELRVLQIPQGLKVFQQLLAHCFGSLVQSQRLTQANCMLLTQHSKTCLASLQAHLFAFSNIAESR